MNIETKNNLNREFILSKLNELEIYTYYMPYKFRLNIRCLNPFKHEKNPSFIIGNKLGNITHKSFNTEHKGDCISFVMQLYNLNYHEAIQKIAEDFKILNSDLFTKIRKSLILEEIKEIPETKIEVITRKFNNTELKYWEDYYQGLQDLQYNNIFAINKVFINKDRIFKYENCLSFAYYYEEIDKFKLYCPFEKEWKWRTNCPFDYIENLNSITNSKFLYISKSKKDAMVLKKSLNTDNIIITQSENPSCFNCKSIDMLKENKSDKIVIFDSDETGTKNSKILTEKYGFSYCNVPKKYIRYNINDFADLAKRYNLKKVYEHFKNKNKC